MRVQILPSGRKVRLLEPVPLRTNLGDLLEIPWGFETDFASIPRLFWRILPPWDKHYKAAVAHDYLYSIGYPREDADQTFLDLMEDAGVAWWKRKAMHRAVRLFGAKHWKAQKTKTIRR